MYILDLYYMLVYKMLMRQDMVRYILVQLRVLKDPFSSS